MADNWRQVAWNGIRFKTPRHWEIGQIGARYLIFENEAGAVMEVKWGSVKGSFSHKRHLKRLVASQARRRRVRIAEWYLPPPWERALTGFETSGFLWQTEKGGVGRGAILFCQACRNATLIQFFGDATPEREKVLLTVLKSFQDHRQDSRILWSVFDIKVTLPEAFKLLHYRFETGKYGLEFNDGMQNIHLQRWAPAAAILSGRDLVWFSATIPEFAARPPQSASLDDANVLEWSASPADKWQQRISRLKVKPSYFWFRLWHLEDKNRILSVRAASKQPLNFKMLKRICAGYDSF